MGEEGIVETVDARNGDDVIATRLGEIGFVNGELVRVVARGPVMGDPVLIQVGFTRFALRRQEARRVRLRVTGQAAAEDAGHD